MSFVKAFAGAIGGTLADQWKDYLSIPNGISDTVAFCIADYRSTNKNRGANTKSSQNLITNGSLVLVPEGFALLTLENGALTGFITEPGGYQWTSDNVNAKSVFAGNGFKESVLWQSWDRFKFGGAPGASQIGLYVNLKEIPNIKFGTQSEIYWDDQNLNAQVGASARGTLTLRISDPIKFIKQFVPASYYLVDAKPFDFCDFDNDAATQLFTEIVGSLSSAFSAYANDPNKQNRITNIQRDGIGFSQALAAAIENNYKWNKDRGLEIVKATIVGVEYSASTKSLISKVQQADALMGARGNSNLQASFADGIKAAGENPEGGALGMGFMGMGFQGAAGSFGSIKQPTDAPQGTSSFNEDPYEKLIKLKGLLDAGVITQEDFDSAKTKLLGI